MDKLSIIVPIYNTEKLLDRCLNSLREETYPNIEFILVNDGSTDDCGEICKRYCDLDDRFKYVFQENKGVSGARNTGIRNATGEWIGFCDSDDWVMPNYYTCMMGCTRNSNFDCIIAGYTIVTDENMNAEAEHATADIHAQNIQDFAKAFWVNYNKGIANCIYNKLFIRKKISFQFDETMTCGEDMVFCMKYLQQVKELAIVDNSGYMYYKPELTSVKYKKNDARQCAKYSASVGEFLSATLDEKEYLNGYRQFVCGNVCRDVAILAKSKPYAEAKRMIREFYTYPILKVSVNRDAWKGLGMKYRVVGNLFQKKMLSLLIACAKLA